MIIDKIENSHLYNKGGRLEKAFNFIKDIDLENKKPGTYEIEGRDIYAIISSYNTKPREEGKFEAHRVYYDLQYMITGSEYIGYAPKNGHDIITPYNPDKDVSFFSGDITFMQMKQGMFAIFYPEDLHMPGILINEPAPVKKLVIKILM